VSSVTAYPSDPSTPPAPAARVLIVEDDTSVREGVTAALAMQSFEVRAVAHGLTLAEDLEGFRPDLVILDVYLDPGPDGFALADLVKVHGAPMLFLTAADAIEQRLRGFELGADEYLVKPFSMAELLARVRVVLRRTGRLVSPTWEVRDVVVDEANRTVLRGGNRVALSKTEFELLRTLGRSPGRVYSKAQLLSEVWGFDAYDPNLVEVYVSSLRRKLEEFGPRMIFTQRGEGYVVRP
jgi:two-component system OmpR family response regulator